MHTTTPDSVGNESTVQHAKHLAWSTDLFTPAWFWNQLAASGHCILWWVPSIIDELFYVLCSAVMKMQSFVFPHCVLSGAGKSWGKIIK